MITAISNLGIQFARLKLVYHGVQSVRVRNKAVAAYVPYLFPAASRLEIKAASKKDMAKMKANIFGYRGWNEFILGC
jgi:hypothetical protein